MDSSTVTNGVLGEVYIASFIARRWSSKQRVCNADVVVRVHYSVQRIDFVIAHSLQSLASTALTQLHRQGK